MVLALCRCGVAIFICCNLCLGLLLNYTLIRNILFHFLFLSALFILPYLGFWQLDRLEWKNELLSNIISRQNQEVINFPYHKNSKDYEHRNASIEGNFIKETQTFLRGRPTAISSVGTQRCTPTGSPSCTRRPFSLLHDRGGLPHGVRGRHGRGAEPQVRCALVRARALGSESECEWE